MLNASLLTLIVIFSSLQGVTTKEFNKKSSNGSFSFSGARCLVAGVFFLALALISGIKFTPEFLPYSISFAASYTCAILFFFLAIGEGSLSLTSLITSYSLILPTLYGILFLNDNITTLLIIGLVLLIISLALVNIESKGEKKKITLKWVLYIIPAFFGNGFCSIFQNMHVRKFEGAYSNEFMVTALVISAVVLLVISLFTEKKDLPSNLKKGAFWYLLCGLSNGGVNLLVLVLTNRGLAPSVMFPVISAGGIVISYVISLVFYKEKFSVTQYIGLALGVISIVLLNFY